MGFGVAIDDVGTRHSNLETVMSLRPHFIKISDVLVRGIARSTVKREMLRSLRHIAETIDAVMIAEGIEHVEDVVALRDLGLRYGQGYYMARPGPPFPTLPDYVRAELRSVTSKRRRRAKISSAPIDDDDDEDDDRDLPIRDRGRVSRRSGDPAQRVRPPRGRDHERLRAPGRRAPAAARIRAADRAAASSPAAPAIRRGSRSAMTRRPAKRCSSSLQARQKTRPTASQDRADQV